MTCTPVLLPDAEDNLARLGKSIRRQVVKKLYWLAEHADVVQHDALTGQWAGLYKLRVGDYRVLYKVNYTRQIISIHVIGHRREIYDVR